MAASKPATVEAAGDLQLLHSAAEEAGRIAMRYFGAANRVWTKSGDSPVSEADIEVDDFLRETLLGARPGHGWLSEETEHSVDRMDYDRIFVVDPIDGTRGFLAGDPQWCICLAVVRQGRPESAVLHCPALERTFSAAAGQGAHLNGRRILNPPTTEIRSVTGSKKLNAEIARLFGDRLDVLPFIPSLAYRIALVANGEVDGAFARPGAHDWDLAAADLILREAGGAVVTTAGKPIRYNEARLGKPSLLAAGPGRGEALLALAKSGGFLQ